MIDEDSDLVCSNMLTQARFDDAMSALFGEHAAGVWADVDALYREIEPPPVAIAATLRVAWLAAPDGAPGYAFVVFYESSTMWSSTAIYNVGRLLER